MKIKKSKIYKKCKSRKGETLVELLVAMLVGVFSCILLSQVIATSTDLNSDSRVLFKSYYDQNNKLTKAFVGDENSGLDPLAGNVIISGKTIEVNGIKYKDNMDTTAYWVEYYVNDKISGEEVVAYRLSK